MSLLRRMGPAILLFAGACASAPPPDRTGATAAQEAPPAAPDAAAAPAAPVAPAPPAAPSRGIPFDAHRTLADGVQIGNLTVWPVLADAAGPADVGAFATLTVAQKRGDAEVREIGATNDLSLAQRLRWNRALQTSGKSQVHGVVIDNGGAAALLVPAGTLVSGGNQDRILEEDLIVAADTAVVARVFCVEHGRSTPERGGKATGGKFQAVEAMAISRVRAEGQYAKSQEGVWEEVADSRARTMTLAGGNGAGGDFVPTGDTSTGSFLVHLDSVPDDVRRARAERVALATARFAALAKDGAHVVGFAYAVNGRPVAARTFASAELLRPRLEGYVDGMVLEAELAKADAAAREPSADEVVALVRTISASTDMKVEERAGYRLRTRSSVKGWSSACETTAGGREVVLSQDWTARVSEKAERRSGR